MSLMAVGRIDGCPGNSVLDRRLLADLGQQNLPKPAIIRAPLGPLSEKRTPAASRDHW